MGFVFYVVLYPNVLDGVLSNDTARERLPTSFSGFPVADLAVWKREAIRYFSLREVSQIAGA
jgi:hypothetical protein